ncbi:tail protein X [Profundibacterium mesophilum]|uniref:Phage tail component protein X n=1 Tax=Profundibacterium mesophilum KAUST100406-0324 TaxID=1037889 RepID=A0A921TC68_9RHOB|nr:tail protein X [Profundibacterium mesophilum]KAF0676725.1 Phage tail component protein X [Profundibacterium mesophilum KAUST100406-0324]
MIVRTRQGDMLDDLLYEAFGHHSDIAAVLDLNPGLAARGPLLPAGLELRLPDTVPSARDVAEPVRLWGRP